MMRKIMLMAALAGCADATVDEDAIDARRAGDGAKQDGFFVGDDSPEEHGALRGANQLSAEQLIGEARLSSRAARGIVAFRAGRDGREGTADDWRFENLDELDAVPYVGDLALEKLVDLARARGWIVPPPALVSTSPASGTEGFDRCGAIELRFSEAIDPESVEISSGGARSIQVDGDRIVVSGWPFGDRADVSVSRLRAAAGGPPMKVSASVQVKLAVTGTPMLQGAWPFGTGVTRQPGIQVVACGLADVKAVSIRLFDGGQEVPLGELTGSSATVWRRPLAPLAADHEYEAVAGAPGAAEKRWRFRTGAREWRFEGGLAGDARQLILSGAADGTVVARHEYGSEFWVGRLGGAFTKVSPYNDETIAVFAQPGGGVRAVWDHDGLWAGSWTPAAGWTTSLVAHTAYGGRGAFLDASWVAYQTASAFELAVLDGGAWRSAVVKAGDVWPEELRLLVTQDGFRWLGWRDRDSGEVYVSHQTSSGWSHHDLRNDRYEHPLLALDGADELHVVTGTSIDGVLTWQIDRSGKAGVIRRLGNAGYDDMGDPHLVPDGKGNLLVLWSNGLGSFARWYRGDLGVWTAREAVGVRISDAVAGPDGTVYVIGENDRARDDGTITRFDGGGLWSGGLGRPWERIADAPAGRLSFVAGTVVVAGSQGLQSLQ